MGGKPTIRGLRFTVGNVLELVSSGLSIEEILEQYPILEKRRYQRITSIRFFKSEKHRNYTCSLNLSLTKRSNSRTHDQSANHPLVSIHTSLTKVTSA